MFKKTKILTKVLTIKILMILCALNVNAATFVVDNSTDVDNALAYTLGDGNNSLRKCMRLAASNAGADVINFNIPGTGPFVITLAGPDLPAVVQRLDIMGLTQPGASAGTIMIEINGAAVGNTLLYDAGSAGSIISGIALGRSNRGIYIVNTSAITVQACNIGNDATGMIARPCNWNGIQVDASPDVVIGGNAGVTTRNIISGNNEVGLRVDNSPRILINGNYFGVNATGNAILKNNWYGVQFVNACHNSVIGNGLAGGGNVSSGHDRDGFNINNSTGVTIKGNIVGLGANGTTVIQNMETGINIYGGSNTFQMGGSTALERNIVSGNNNFGVRVFASTNGFIQGNIIGADVTGTVDVGNRLSGIALYSASNTTTIGGLGAGQGNLISGNNENGIYIESSTGASIARNIIGLNATGTGLLSNSTNGVLIVATSTAPVLQNNIVSGNLNAGIFITQSTDPVLYGNYVGTDITGSVDFGNAQSGVVINNNSHNPILGSATAGQGNLVSGNNETGVNINSCNAPIIKGNIIGLNAAANALLMNNFNGLLVENSPNPIIGGGASLTEKNIVSGNGQNGMLIITSISPTIRGNIVGTDITGMVDFGNTGNGIQLVNTCTDPLIGGATAGQGNLISGNGGAGLTLDNCLRPIIKGNVIGLGSDGNTVIANNGPGISLFTGCNSPIIGGSTIPEKNLVSGNSQIGIHVNASTNPTVYGNYIGTDVTGLLDRGNGEHGLFINNGSTTAIIGSATAGTGNLVSGNNQRGIFVLNSAGPSIKGNIVGLGINGTTAVGNTEAGVYIEASNSPVVGGTTLPERNLVSSNGGNGITVYNSTNPIVKANYVGVDVTGLLARGNLNTGVYIVNGSTAAIIGGSTLTEGNIVSNSGWAGILVENSTDVIIKANIIGLGSDITTAFGNAQGGISCINNSHRIIIGGVLVAERNYVSSNTGNGINIVNTDDASVVNNYVGVEVTGLVARSNTGNGVNVELSLRVLIGGTTTTARNIISYNGSNGVRLANNANDAVIKANYIGVGSDGVTSLGNWDNGIYTGGTSNNATVGGSLAVEMNVLSANGRSGVGDGFRSESCNNHVIRGNFCGVDATGTVIVGNAWAGISINESNDCIVGGTGALDGNICSGNLNEGVYFRNAVRTLFIGNFVGTNRTGTAQLGNEDYGVNIRAASLNNTVGGSGAQANTIAYCKNIAGSGPGVFVEGASQYNLITYNKIYCNAGKGIELNGTANESIAKPVILTSDANTITGTGSVNGDIIHVYLNNTTGTGCDCEGEQFIGTAVVTGGAWSLTHSLGYVAAQYERLSATETTALNSTSEFADCIVPMPVSLIYFKADKLNGHASILQWQTGYEKDNDYFIVERSSDGVHFEKIGIVKGSGNSATLLNYSFTDEDPLTGINYYRLKQVDFDGQSEYSVIRTVYFGESALAIASDGSNSYILASTETNASVYYEIYAADGKLVRKGNVEITNGKNKIELDLTGLATSVYYIKVISGENSIADKLFVK